MYSRTIKSSPKTGKVTLKQATAAAKAVKAKKAAGNDGKKASRKK